MVTELGKMSKQDLDNLPSMEPEEAALVLRDALGWAAGRCTSCNENYVVRRRPGTSFAGSCSCGGAIELVGHS